MWIKYITTLLIGLVITGIISAGPGYIVSKILDLNTIYCVILSSIIICPIVLLLNSLDKRNQIRKDAITLEELNSERNRYQRVDDILCYKCRNHNSCRIQINTENFFDCESCGTNNKILIGLKSVVPSALGNTFDMDQEILDGKVGI